jgi:hypothetical protein
LDSRTTGHDTSAKAITMRVGSMLDASWAIGVDNKAILDTTDAGSCCIGSSGTTFYDASVITIGVRVGSMRDAVWANGVVSNTQKRTCLASD